MLASVRATRDPGYGSTSKMISESALALIDNSTTAGGVWTPGAALGRRWSTACKPMPD